MAKRCSYEPCVNQGGFEWENDLILYTEFCESQTEMSDSDSQVLKGCRKLSDGAGRN